MREFSYLENSIFSKNADKHDGFTVFCFVSLPYYVKKSLEKLAKLQKTRLKNWQSVLFFS